MKNNVGQEKSEKEFQITKDYKSYEKQLFDELKQLTDEKKQSEA